MFNCQLEQRNLYAFWRGPCSVLLVCLPHLPEQHWATGLQSAITELHAPAALWLCLLIWWVRIEMGLAWSLRADPVKAGGSAGLLTFLWEASLSGFHRALLFSYTFLPAKVSEVLPQKYRFLLHLKYVVSISLWHAFLWIPRHKHVKYYKNKNLWIPPPAGGIQA